MKELAQYEPLTEISANLRFATYRGELEGENVFVKVAANDETRELLLTEATGLVNMRELDMNERFYRTPSVITVTPDYIVTSWADGHPMKDDFKGDDRRVAGHLNYLAELFAFVDSRTSGSLGVTRYNRPGKQHGVDEILAKLESVEYGRHIDAGLVRGIAEYARGAIPGAETRFTNGDLQPSNLLIDTTGKVTVVDCESCSWLWPRHYNIVNFIFNYGSAFEWLRPQLPHFFNDYCQKTGIDASQAVDAFNLSAAMRCLQIIYENLGHHMNMNKTPSAQLSSHLKTYVTAVIQRILSKQLFFQFNP